MIFENKNRKMQVLWEFYTGNKSKVLAGVTVFDVFDIVFR